VILVRARSSLRLTWQEAWRQRETIRGRLAVQVYQCDLTVRSLCGSRTAGTSEPLELPRPRTQTRVFPLESESFKDSSGAMGAVAVALLKNRAVFTVPAPPVWRSTANCQLAGKPVRGMPGVIRMAFAK
jgi:hypothetical protein